MRYLPAYGGALAVRLNIEQARAQQKVSDNPPPADGNTPPEVVAQLQEAALLRSFPPEIASGGIEHVSGDEFERMAASGS